MAKGRTVSATSSAHCGEGVKSGHAFPNWKGRLLERKSKLKKNTVSLKNLTSGCVCFHGQLCAYTWWPFPCTPVEMPASLLESFVRNHEFQDSCLDDWLNCFFWKRNETLVV